MNASTPQTLTDATHKIGWQTDTHTHTHTRTHTRILSLSLSTSLSTWPFWFASSYFQYTSYKKKETRRKDSWPIERPKQSMEAVKRKQAQKEGIEAQLDAYLEELQQVTRRGRGFTLFPKALIHEHTHSLSRAHHSTSLASCR